MRIIPLFVGLLALSVTSIACVSFERQHHEKLQVVAHVDISRYAGIWYEIARYPNRFQKGCVATTARYTIRDDGDIDVLNQCRENTLDGNLLSVKGTAKL